MTSIIKRQAMGYALMSTGLDRPQSEISAASPEDPLGLGKASPDCHDKDVFQIFSGHLRGVLQEVVVVPSKLQVIQILRVPLQIASLWRLYNSGSTDDL